MGRQRALYTENSGFAHATLPWHISTFHGYQILFSNGRGISDYVIFGQKYRLDLTSEAIFCLVRDSSVIRWLFVRLAEAVGRQSALDNENSEFAAPTLGRHLSTFHGYRILLVKRFI